MGKRFLWIMALALIVTFHGQTRAGAGADINISVLPLSPFSGPPELVVIPETNVYVVSSLDDVDIFFCKGWWWRLWEEKWYRSRNYDSGWVRYSKVPSFYEKLPSGWRSDYRAHLWKGHRWDYPLISSDRVQGNWSRWEKDRYWERHNTWNVQGLKKQTVRRRGSGVRKTKAPPKAQPQELRGPTRQKAVPQQKRNPRPQMRHHEESR